MVENSASMRQLQSGKLQSIAEVNGWNISWVSSLDEVHHEEEIYTMIVAHEFFDALPFHLLEVR